MYTPEHVRAIDPTVTARVIAEAPLACIVARPADGLVANPVPVLAAADGAPIGHVALANDMNRRILAGQEVLAIFRGADGSVSPATRARPSITATSPPGTTRRSTSPESSPRTAPSAPSSVR
jgi:predicted FMN-binding regulatory protein PaiB